MFWRPSTEQVDLIRREWELFRIEIERGDSANLTPASETKAIHIRPHARDSRDTRDAPGAGQVVKQSFWLESAVRPTDPDGGRPPLADLIGQRFAYPADEPDDQSVAHHERAAAVGHPCVRPVIRETVEPFELQGGQTAESPIARIDHMLEAGRRDTALAGEDRARWLIDRVREGDPTFGVAGTRARSSRCVG